MLFLIVFCFERFPSDNNTYIIDRQMLLGGEMLISPVLDPGVDSVEAYIPDARWYDFYTGEFNSRKQPYVKITLRQINSNSNKTLFKLIRSLVIEKRITRKPSS